MKNDEVPKGLRRSEHHCRPLGGFKLSLADWPINVLGYHQSYLRQPYPFRQGSEGSTHPSRVRADAFSSQCNSITRSQTSTNDWLNSAGSRRHSFCGSPVRHLPVFSHGAFELKFSVPEEGFTSGLLALLGNVPRRSIYCPFTP